MSKENKKILAINKPIEELTDREVDEVIDELVKNGTLKKDKSGNIFKPEYELQFLGPTDFIEVCEVCRKKLEAKDRVRPWSIGAGYIYWCENCDKTETPIIPADLALDNQEKREQLGICPKNSIGSLDLEEIKEEFIDVSEHVKEIDAYAYFNKVTHTEYWLNYSDEVKKFIEENDKVFFCAWNGDIGEIHTEQSMYEKYKDTNLYDKKEYGSEYNFGTYENFITLIKWISVEEMSQEDNMMIVRLK